MQTVRKTINRGSPRDWFGALRQHLRFVYTPLHIRPLSLLRENLMTPAWKWSEPDHGWRTQVSLPRLGAWRSLWNVFPGSVEGPYEHKEDTDQSVEVAAAAPEEGRRPKTPSPAQVAAFVHLSENDEALERALAQYLFDAMRGGRLGHVIPEPGDAENDDELRLFQHLHRPEAMRELLRLNEVKILNDEEDALAHLVLSFESAFDAEHGLSVRVHGTSVLSLGGMGDEGGWPPPSAEDFAEMATMFGLRGPQDERRRLRETLEAALADPANGKDIRELTQAALALADAPNQHLEITLQIDTPPVTRIEKVYYGRAGTLSYDLMLQVGLDSVIYKDSNTPRQAGLQGAPWPLSLFAVQCRWPAARPRWDTVKVRRIDKAASMRKAKSIGPEVPELRAVAERALREGFDPTSLAKRGWRLAPDPSESPYESDPTPQEQTLGAGMNQALQALRGLLTGDPTAPQPPDLGALMAGMSGAPGVAGLFGRMTAACELVPLTADAWAWSDDVRGKAAEKALSQAGLHRADYFQIVIPFSPQFASYVDPKSRFYALIYDDIYQRTVTLECRSLYDDGVVYSVTTRAASATSPLPPWRHVEVLPEDTPDAEVVKRFLARRPPSGLRPIAREHFVTDFQEVWRRETEWRANQRR